jgi:type I restriction enzyme S subunit
MGITTEDWSHAPLDELLIHVIGGDWGKDESFNEDDYEMVSCIRGSEFKNWKKELGSTAVNRRIKTSSLNSRKLKDGDLLIEISGGGPDQPVGRTVLITSQVLEQLEHPAVCTNFLRMARPSREVNSNYLNYYLTKFYLSGEVVRYQGGSNNLRNLKFKDYSGIAIPLPPLAEQKVIAEKLDTLLAQVDTTKARLERIPDIIKRFRQSVLAAAVSGKLTEEWRMTNSCEEALSLIEETSIGNRSKKELEIINKPLGNEEILLDIPESWAWTRLSRITEIASGVAKGGKGSGEQISLPYLRVANVQRGYLDLEEIKNITVSKDKAEKLYLKFGDVLFNEGGDLDKLGRGWIWEEQIENCIHQNHVFRARVCSSLFEPKFISYYGNSEGKEYFYRNGTQSVNLASINKTVLSLLPVPVPPAKEQTEIVRRVEELFAFADTIEQKAAAALERVNNLTQSILAKAFRGELTADWRAANPELISGDNSAEALLAKIQAEREALKPVKKTRKKKAKA